MKIERWGSHLLDSRFSSYFFDISTRLAYLDWLRKPVIDKIAKQLKDSTLWEETQSRGWQKIQQQYKDIFLAVLNSLDRSIEKRVLAPSVARVIFELWGRALFPSKERKEAVERFRQTFGSPPPWFMVISPTRSCNLKCTGCYANADSNNSYSEKALFSWNVLDRIMTEAKQLWGVPLIVFSGGEPLTYRSQGKDLLDIIEKHTDCLFLMFTNGTLITQETAQRLARLGNLTPSLSVEGLSDDTDQRRGAGVYKQVLDAMANLRQAGVPFGISMTATRENCHQLLSDQVLDFYFQEQGAFYAFIFQYMPIGRSPNLDWMPRPDQRIPFYRRSWEVVRDRRYFLLDFWNHGPLVEGCIAAGRDRGYLHIDWHGDVMPCVFMPYVATNILDIYNRGGTLNDVWTSPFFQVVRQWQCEHGYGCDQLSKEGNWMMPCPVRDHFATFNTWIESQQLQPERGVAPEIVDHEDFVEKMLLYDREQAESLQPLWEQEYLD